MTGQDHDELLAGVEGLRRRNLAWCQVDLAQPGVAVSDVAGALAPVLVEFGPRRWWLVRKEPGARVRVETLDAGDRLADAVLAALGVLGAARPSTYEPETYRFGGDEGIDIAHDHFALDSALAALVERVPDVSLRRWSTAALLDLSRRVVDDPAEWWDAWKQLESVVVPLVGALPQASDPQTATASTSDRLITAMEAGNSRVAARLRDATLLAGVGRRTWFAAAAVFHWNRLGFHPAQMAAVIADALAATTAPAPADAVAAPMVLHVELGSGADRCRFLVDEVGALVPQRASRVAFVDLGDGRFELLLRDVDGDALRAWLAALLASGVVRSARQPAAALCLTEGLVPAGAAFARYEAGLFECSERALALLGPHGERPETAVMVAELARIHGEQGDVAASARWHLGWLRALDARRPWPEETGSEAETQRGEPLLAARLAHIQWLRLNGGAADPAAEMEALGLLVG